MASGAEVGGLIGSTQCSDAGILDMDRLGIAAASTIVLQQAILHASIRILDFPSIKQMGNTREHQLKTTGTNKLSSRLQRRFIRR